MPELSKDFVALLQYLAPGFVVAWVYYGLTSHVKPSQFERVVQALIFTVVIQAILLCEKWTALQVGRIFILGDWTSNTHLVFSLVTALCLGIFLSTCTNSDVVHGWIRKAGISKRSAHPCEWFGIFSDYPRYVVLQLKDGTRIYGWPNVWPSEYDRGHFFITSAMRSVGELDQDLDALEGILIDVKEVSSVEFVKKPEKLNDQTASKTPSDTTPICPPAG